MQTAAVEKKSADSSDGDGGSAGSSTILNYFKKKKASKEIKMVHVAQPIIAATNSSNEENECSDTPSSNEAVMKEGNTMKSSPARRRNMLNSKDNIANNETESSSMDVHDVNNGTSATPDTLEPTTPPSHLNDQEEFDNNMGDNNVKVVQLKSMAQAQSSSETPPTGHDDNETELCTTPPSPPTPDTWIDSITVDQNEIDTTNNKQSIKRRANPTSNEEKESLSDDATETPLSLLREDVPILPYKQPQYERGDAALNMGTPSTACTPSTASASGMSKSNNFFRKYASSSKKSSNTKKKKNQGAKQQIAKKEPPIKRQKQQSNQLFLDFGQTSFGKQMICNICGMLRVHGLDEDDAQHDKICKEYKEGVTCIGWKNEREVSSFGKDDRILEVRPEDAQLHKKKVQEVKKIVDIELGFASGSSSNKHEADDANNMTSYLYISKKRVVGLLVVKRIQRAYELKEGGCGGANHSSSSISRSLQPSKALLGIHQLWVHNSHRHGGIASKLVTAARDHLIFGMVVSSELIAFSSPTDDGLNFAKRYTGSERPLIYDVH